MNTIYTIKHYGWFGILRSSPVQSIACG